MMLDCSSNYAILEVLEITKGATRTHAPTLLRSKIPVTRQLDIKKSQQNNIEEQHTGISQHT
jgi:hypothetical protein